MPSDPASEAAPSAARVTLYSRAGCHLCEQARDLIAAVCAELGERFIELDIDQPDQVSDELRERMTDEVPVTYVDGKQHDFWRVDPARLRAALTSQQPR